MKNRSRVGIIGGGIFGLLAPITVTNSEVNSNVSKNFGGGIWAGTSLVINDSMINNNLPNGIYLNKKSVGNIIKSEINKNNQPKNIKYI